MKILAIAPHICRTDTSAGDLRLARLLEILATFCEVDFLVPQIRGYNPSETHYWDQLDAKNIRVLHPSLWNRFELVATATPYDFILAEFWHIAERILPIVEKLRQSQPNLKLITDSVDMHFLRELAELEIRPEKSPSDLDAVLQRKARELDTYRKSDLVIVVTEEDRLALLENDCQTPTLMVPIIVELSGRICKPEPNTMVFVGGFKHTPNIDACVWFVRDIFPKITSRIPQARFQIVGSGPTQEILDLGRVEGVEVLGFVKDTREPLSKGAISVAPLRYGAGMKGKVVEALSMGLPIVTTTFGAQGLEAQDGKHMRIADDSDSFAKHVCDLLSNPHLAESMGADGQALVAKRCGPESIKELLQSTLTQSATQSTSGSSRFEQFKARCTCKALVLKSDAKRAGKRIFTSILSLTGRPVR
jgi:glycosyltransferase involved in cell wall biosynthesis